MKYLLLFDGYHWYPPRFAHRPVRWGNYTSSLNKVFIIIINKKIFDGYTFYRYGWWVHKAIPSCTLGAWRPYAALVHDTHEPSGAWLCTMCCSSCVTCLEGSERLDGSFINPQETQCSRHPGLILGAAALRGSRTGSGITAPVCLS